MRILTALLLTTLPVLALNAQDELVAEVSETRRYAVEMIIFRYAQEVSTGSEVFLAEQPALEAPIIDEEPLLIDGEPLEEIPPVSRIYRDIELTLLPEDQYTMEEIMSRLERLDVYEPLMHFAWTQATWRDEDSQPIELASLGVPPPGLNGRLHLYLSRYLHLVVDLQLDAPLETAATDGRRDTISSVGDYRSLNSPVLPSERYDVAASAPVRYHIEENRILRSGDIRYFDHPKFGVLAKVTRAEERPEDPLETDDSELLGYPAE